MFLRNCWYVAAWDYEITEDNLLARKIINEPIVLFRKENGEVAALQDRCCHRAAPLSIGRKEGDAVRCMYHGLKFDSSGTCVDIPGQDSIPPQACVRSFPVVVQSSWVWVWMGDPSKASIDLIPPAVALDNPDWNFRSGSIEYQANYLFVNDNLLDFSHLTFLHPNSFGVGEDWAQIRPKVTRLERGVRIERWLPKQPIPNHIKDVVDAEYLDMYSHYDYLAPGVMVMYSYNFPGGTYEKYNGGHPDVMDCITREVNGYTRENAALENFYDKSVNVSKVVKDTVSNVLLEATKIIDGKVSDLYDDAVERLENLHPGVVRDRECKYVTTEVGKLLIANSVSEIDVFEQEEAIDSIIKRSVEANGVINTVDRLMVEAQV